MADAIYHTKQQRQQKQATPSKIYSHFLYKALIVTIFLVILPLFPTQAPEFINHTLNTRGWEFLQLLFVGIAVSYGLFSRRNDETDKENNNNNNYYHSRFDNAQSYLSRFLQVSSIFDDEADNWPRAADMNKVQTWSNKYNRNEPVVVLAEEQPVPDEERLGASLRISQRPLLLPVRSLRSRVVDADANQSRRESAGISTSISRSGSNSSFKRLSCDFSSKSEEFERLDQREMGDKLKDNVVLPSPIPWRSRSGRMESKELKEDDSPSLFTLPSSMEEAELNSYSIAKIPRSTRPNSTNSSPKLSPSSSLSSQKKTSPSTSFSFGAHAKIAEDSVRKKSTYRSPPPPPPPPPPAIRRSSSIMTPRPNAIEDGEFSKNDFKRSFTSKPRDLNTDGNVAVPKSVKTIRSNDPLAGAWVEKGFDDGVNNKTGGFDQLPFKTERLNRDNITSMPQPTFREFPKEEKEGLIEKLVVECDEDSQSEEEDDEIAEISAISGAVSSTKDEQAASGSANDGGPDVDKKADEFIAKFREQIRLQRIESIKRSSAEIRKKGPR